jgi:hypothetical protein
VVELAKLTDYCLEGNAPARAAQRAGGRVFSARLGLARADAALLRAELPRAGASSTRRSKAPPMASDGALP